MSGGKVPMGKREKTITVKIAGKERPYIEERKSHPKNKSKQVFQTNSEPGYHSIGAEFESKEGLQANYEIVQNDSFDAINHVTKEKQSAIKQLASTEEFDEKFSWILPDESEQDQKTTKPSVEVVDVRPKNKKKHHYFKVRGPGNKHVTAAIVTIILAVLVGTSFGSIIKKYLIQDIATESTTAESQQKAKADEMNQNPSPKENKSVTVPELSTFVVQGGVFSTVEAAQQVANELTTKQIPAYVIEEDKQALLYLATSDTLEHAKEIAVGLQEKGAEVYTKQLIINEKSLTGVSDKEQAFITDAVDFFDTLTMAGSALFLTNTLTEQLKGMVEKQLTMLSTHQIENEQLAHLKNELIAANTAFKAYEQEISEQRFVTLQHHLLTCIKHFDSL